MVASRDVFRVSETDLKRVIKDYLAVKHIYNFPIMQGLGSQPGLPDRIMHFKGQVHYLEIKKPKGKLSAHQLKFQEQCKEDKIPYHVLYSIEDLQNIMEGE